MIVLDASAVVELLVRSPAGVVVERRLAREPRPLHAPHLLDAEVAHALRRVVASGSLRASSGRTALQVLPMLPIRRHGHLLLLERVWALRDNVTAYDAMYVALAERLGATLLTRDARLAAAPGVRAAVEVV